MEIKKMDVKTKVALAASGLLAALWIVALFQNNNLKHSLAENQAKFERLDEAIKGYDIRVKADQLYISGNYDSASYYYKLLKNFDLESDELLKQRITLIENTEQSEMQRELSSKEMIMKINMLENKNTEFEKRHKHTDSLYNSQKDDLSACKKERTALNDSIIVLRSISKQKTKSAVDTLMFTVSTGNKVRYHGEVQNDRANGMGAGFWSVGSYYYGEWKNNLRHGQGTYIWKEGHKFTGTFKNDVREGYGVYRWPNGEYYEGEWKENKRNGQGTLYNADGFIKFSGIWTDDKPANGVN